MARLLRACFISLVMVSCLVSPARAAVGCTLNDPDRDVKRLFPESTRYRTDFITIREKGGEELKKKIEERLGNSFDSIYETIDVPYAYYEILQGKTTIGRIHGVNQKGTYGGMQIILATDLDGKILAFYYQKISSPEARKFRDESFTSKFIGMTLDDFNTGTIAIEDPSEKNHEDFLATLRGIKKNLLLLHEFWIDGEAFPKTEGGGK